MTKLGELGKIWTQWNARELPGDAAMHQIGKLFPRATMKAWNLEMDRRSEVLYKKEVSP